MTGERRALVYVQHLLGVGHLKRALLVAGALAEHGLRVLVVSGGPPARLTGHAGVELFQLPPVRAADAAFSALADMDGNPVDEAFRTNRRERLLRRFREFKPHVLIVEAFPFGRRQLRFELIPLLDAARNDHPRPVILCSVRDILQEKKDPERLEEQVQAVRRYFDRVLVHGDPTLVRLDESFPRFRDIEDLVTYTGYVSAPPPQRSCPAIGGAAEVVVSAGGGTVGLRLLETARDAQPVSGPSGATWRLLVGHNVPATEFDALRQGGTSQVVVERARPDFPDLLARCAVSISQCGYNTVMDVLSSATPAVVVPFRGAGETEQALRAEKLGARNLVQVVDEADLTPERLTAAVGAALHQGRPPHHGLDLNGAHQTARLVESCLEGGVG